MDFMALENFNSTLLPEGVSLFCPESNKNLSRPVRKHADLQYHYITEIKTLYHTKGSPIPRSILNNANENKSHIDFENKSDIYHKSESSIDYENKSSMSCDNKLNIDYENKSVLSCDNKSDYTNFYKSNTTKSSKNSNSDINAYETQAENDSKLADFREKTIRIIEGEIELSAKYPKDIICNIARCGPFAFGKKDSIDPQLLALFEEAKIEVIPVNQGYTGCGCLCIKKFIEGNNKNENSKSKNENENGENNKLGANSRTLEIPAEIDSEMSAEYGLITADVAIYEAACLKNIKALLIPPQKNILLPGFSLGFIGGIGGQYEDSLYITGKLDFLESSKDLRTFIESFSIRIVELTPNKPVDIGGIIFI